MKTLYNSKFTIECPCLPENSIGINVRQKRGQKLQRMKCYIVRKIKRVNSKEKKERKEDIGRIINYKGIKRREQKFKK